MFLPCGGNGDHYDARTLFSGQVTKYTIAARLTTLAPPCDRAISRSPSAGYGPCTGFLLALVFVDSGVYASTSIVTALPKPTPTPCLSTSMATIMQPPQLPRYVASAYHSIFCWACFPLLTHIVRLCWCFLRHDSCAVLTASVYASTQAFCPVYFPAHLVPLFPVEHGIPSEEQVLCMQRVPQMHQGCQYLRILILTRRSVQFWVHTCLVRRLGPIEWIFSTPSHHRMHHDRRLHKNFGGILIIWDRMFGT